MPEEAILDSFLAKGAATGAEAGAAATDAATKAVTTTDATNVDVDAGAATPTKPQTSKVFGEIVPSMESLQNIVPTGGVGLLLTIALIVVFAIIPTTAGPSRLSLIWQAFLGNAKLGDGSGSSVTSTPSFGYTTSIPGTASGNYHAAYPGGPMILGH